MHVFGIPELWRKDIHQHLEVLCSLSKVLRQVTYHMIQLPGIENIVHYNTLSALNIANSISIALNLSISRL